MSDLNPFKCCVIQVALPKVLQWAQNRDIAPLYKVESYNAANHGAHVIVAHVIVARVIVAQISSKSYTLFSIMRSLFLQTSKQTIIFNGLH